MQQPDLFNPFLAAAMEPRKLARRGAPTTSKLAALTVPNFAGQHHAVIVQALKDHGGAGLTVHEAAGYCRLTAHEIGKRMHELEAGRVIETRTAPDSDAVLTRPSPSGRQARVWFLKESAR